MEDATLPSQNFNNVRHLPTHHFSPFPHHHQNSPTAPPPSYPPHHLDPSLNTLDNGDGFQTSFGPNLDDPSTHSLPLGTPFARGGPPTHQPQRLQQPHQRLQEARQSHLASPTQQQQQHAVPSSSQFAVLSQSPQLNQTYVQHAALERIQQENGLLQDRSASGAGKKDGGDFPGMKKIQSPPNLEGWRQKLFDVDEPITLTEDDFQTYFPHVDNVYSHRSTQRYKRKPFVSHYYDCRLKGRPPGTPKSDDPNKKKRKRQARERDLCDVKIKITEYFPGARATMAQLGEEPNDGTVDNSDIIYPTENHAFGIMNSDPGTLPGANGERYYTISRVNGSNTGGKGEGVPGAHRHTLEESDRIKKSSVQRQFLKDEKDRRKSLKTYHKRATGEALQTVKRHSKDTDLKLYGSCFCPFVQRVWIALELKNLPYQYIEVDPYKKTQTLLAVNPKGLVPALQHDSFSCHESTVLLEYIEDAFPDRALMPSTPQGRARARLWADHVNRHFVPAFYRTLQAQDVSDQAANAAELRSHIESLVDAASPTGPFFDGPTIGWVDVQLAPWLLRLSRVLSPYRGWPEPEQGSRWGRWVDAVESNIFVKGTTSGDELYRDDYERYAENRPNTSQVADAVNCGRGLP